MQTDAARIKHLVEYVQGMMNKESGKELYLKYRSDIEQVTPQEVFEIFFSTMEKGKEPAEILESLDRVINVFYRSLSAYIWEKPDKSSFLGYLMQENKALLDRLDEIKEIIKAKGLEAGKAEILPRIRQLEAFNHHYLKKENILFPFLEKKMKKFEGLAIMWALHDEARARLKKTVQLLETDTASAEELSGIIGSLFFVLHGLVQKEELILFPSATEIINGNEWHEMYRQSLEYEFPFINKPEADFIPAPDSELIAGAGQGFQLKTENGVLDFEQILLIFNSLPVDMTFVDENNKVKFFSKPKDRIFPRSPAVIGRDVEKCHPPESVHVVREIIESFRSGKEDSASFWINIKGKKLLIQYFAVRNAAGEFRGTLEVSQDITEIQKLEGERRLLNWGK